MWVFASSLVLGKLSGRHAFKERLAELGFVLSEDDFIRAFNAFKELADKKKEVTDKDIESLVAEEHLDDSRDIPYRPYRGYLRRSRYSHCGCKTHWPGKKKAS